MSSEKDTQLDAIHIADQENPRCKSVIRIDLDEEEDETIEDGPELNEIVSGLKLNTLFQKAIDIVSD